MKLDALTVGSLVYVTCYGPCWGLRGIIRTIDMIVLSDTPEPLYFYLVALQGGEIKEPVWFVHDDVAEVEGDGFPIPHHLPLPAKELR